MQIKMELKRENNRTRPKLSVLLCIVIAGAFIFVLGIGLGFKILPEFVEKQIWTVTKQFSL